MSSYSAWQSHPHNVPPPFQGAPPIPIGVNVPQSHWNQGTWMPNPHYNPQASRSNINVAQWMPGNGWGIQQPNVYYPAYQQQQQQQQQSFNPYKRQPKPPSAEYLALKLSDNPLGLTNMVPAEEVERQERERQLQEQENHAQATPWLWAPRQLDDDGDADNRAEADDARKPATPQIPDPPPEPFASKATLQPTFSSSIVRTPQHYRSNTPVQIYASPKRAIDRGSSVDNLASDIGRLSTGPATSAPLIRHHSMPTTLSANYPNTASSITGESLTREPDPMELLSPLAGVLPPPKSGSSRSNLGRHSSVPVTSNSSSLDPIPESSAAKSLSHSRSHTPAPSSHRHHEPVQSSSSHSRSKSSSSRSNSASPYSNEQSPVSPTYAYSSSSGHSPYYTHHPSSSSSSPSYQQDPLIRNPLPAPPKPYEPRNSESTGSNHHHHHHHHHHQHASPGTSNSSYLYMPPPTSAPPQSSSSSSNTRSRSSSSAAAAAAPYTQPSSAALLNYTEEPGTVVLHANGKSTVINLSSSSSPHEIASLTQPASSSSPSTTTATATTTTTTTTTTSTSTAPIDSPKKRKKSKHQLRRKGFWNRRGDHVTADGYIVYAPPDLVYPPDLDGYPDGKDEGYMNEDGHITSWHKRPAYNPPGGYSSIIEYV